MTQLAAWVIMASVGATVIAFYMDAIDQSEEGGD